MLTKFAEEYNVKTRRDDCGDTVVQGRAGGIGDGYTDRLGAYVTLPTKKRWNNARRQMEAAGFHIRQDADTEGIGLFDPANPVQAHLALKLARVKSRRMAAAPSTAQMAARKAFATGRRAA